MNQRHIRNLALQASGEYLMNHIAGVMEMVQDQRSERQEPRLDEEMLSIIEAQTKAIAEELTQQSKEHP